MSDRIAVMSRGLVDQVGTPEELYESPRTRFVAGFIGTSNFIEVVPRRDLKGGVVVFREGERLCLDLSGVDPVPERVEVSVRPEKIVLREPEEGAPEGWCVLRGQVRDVVYLGMTSQYKIDVPSLGKQFTVLEQNVEVASEQTQWARAEETLLTWHPSHNRVLPAEEDGWSSREEEGA